jgi:predicted secreted protein
MGSIQNRRGSARQAPPSVYQAFLSVPDSEENDNAILATAWIISVITGMFFGLGVLAYFLESVGWWTPD